MNNESSDDNIIRLLKSMLQPRMEQPAKNGILNNIRTEKLKGEKEQKKILHFKKLAACITAVAAVVLLFFGLYTDAGKGYAGRLWSIFTPSVNQSPSGIDKADNVPPPVTPTKDDITNTKTQTDLTFSSIKMYQNKTGWAVASKSILHTDDNGLTWNDVTPSNFENGMEWKPSFSGSLNGWVTIPDNDWKVFTLYHTKDGGKSWSNSRVTKGGMCADIKFTDAKNGWMFISGDVAMHHEVVTIMKSSDSGATWSTVFKIDPNIPEKPGDLPFAGLKSGFVFPDVKTGWITGDEPMEGFAYLYTTKDGGQTWKPKSLPLSEDMKKSELMTSAPEFFTSEDGVLTVKYYSNNDKQQYIFYITHDGGDTWKASTPVSFSSSTQASWDIIDIDNWIGVDGSFVYRTTDGGQTWVTTKLNIELSNILSLDFSSAASGWAITEKGLFKSEDGGSTWSKAEYSIK